MHYWVLFTFIHLTANTYTATHVKYPSKAICSAELKVRHAKLDSTHVIHGIKCLQAEENKNLQIRI